MFQKLTFEELHPWFAEPDTPDRFTTDDPPEKEVDYYGWHRRQSRLDLLGVKSCPATSPSTDTAPPTSPQKPGKDE